MTWRSGTPQAVAAAGDDVAERVRVLADGLTADGYAASGAAGPRAAWRTCSCARATARCSTSREEFPELCEAEARAFSRLLGVHVQRLATLAGGAHVCTTNIPADHSRPRDAPTPAHHPAPSVEGQSA